MSKANELRAALKAAGFSARQATVRAGACSLTVTIRDAKIPAQAVSDVASAFHKVHYCEASGEILLGANTFVSVGYEAGLLAPLEAEILAHLRTGAQEWRGHRVVAGSNNSEDGYTVYGDWPARTFVTWTLEAAAEELAARTAGWVQWEVACDGTDDTTATLTVWAPTAEWATTSATGQLDCGAATVTSVKVAA